MGRVLGIFVVLVLSVALWAPHAGAQEGAIVSVDPPRHAVGADAGPFDINILVDDVTGDMGLGGYTLVVEYDPAVLRGVGVTDSGFVGSTGNAALCPSSGIDNDAGRLAHFCFTVPLLPEPGPRTTEPELLVTVTFEPVGEGTTTLDIGETTLSDPEGNTFVPETRSGEITVGDARPQEDADATVPSDDAGSDGNGTPETLLPTSGGGAEGGTDRSTLYIIAIIVVGSVAAASVGAVLFLRMRRAP